MDPAQTRRVILLIDLHPLFAVQDPSHYVAAVLASARRLLSFPPLSGSLFAFKPYFSSLSPLRSSSLIQRLFGKSAIFLSFDRPSQIIKLLSASLHPSNYDGDIIGRLDRPRASLVRDSLFQLAYDCMWEPPGESSVDKSGISSVRSNMIVNFSPIPRSENCLSQFLDLSTSDEIKSEMNEIRNKFVQIFGPLNELFISKDVHFSWIHVDRDSQLSVNLLYKEFIDIGWSTCSAHAIAFGAVFIPFGLIYSYIGHQLPSYSVDVQGQCRVDLNLEISDARGESLECKCCDLDVHFLKNQRETTGILDFFSRDAQGLPRMVVKDVLHLSNLSKIKSRRVATLLLRGVCDIEERVDDKTGVFSPTKILELFREDGVSPAAGKPIWQLVLSFLQRRSFCALVSVDRGNGQSLCGYMLPFTVHSAVMYVVDDLILDNCGPHCSEPAKDKHRRRKKNRIQRLVHELNYYDFYKHVFNENSETNLEVDLEDLYFAKGCNISKKLRFFQCWMKQFRNHSHSCTDVSGHGISSGCKEVKGERPVGSELDTSRPASPISCSDDIIQFVEKNEECPSQILRQSMESFSETVSLKNKRILSSKESDLSLFAERIVKLAANYFSAKLGSGEKKDDLNAVVAAEVLKALLERPKDILAKYKSPCVLDEVIKVREYPFQFFVCSNHVSIFCFLLLLNASQTRAANFDSNGDTPIGDRRKHRGKG